MKKSTGESKICLLQYLCLSLWEQESFFLHFSLFFFQHYFSQRNFKRNLKINLMKIFKQLLKKGIWSLIRIHITWGKDQIPDQIFLFVTTTQEPRPKAK